MYIDIHIDMEQENIDKKTTILIIRSNETMRAMMLWCLLSLLWLLPILSGSNPSPSIESFLECLPRTSPSPITIYTQNTTIYTTFYKARFLNPRTLASPSSRTPLLIIVPSKEVHVQAIVIRCRRNGLQLLVRSGGHD